MQLCKTQAVLRCSSSSRERRLGHNWSAEMCVVAHPDVSELASLELSTCDRITHMLVPGLDEACKLFIDLEYGTIKMRSETHKVHLGLEESRDVPSHH